MKQQSSTGFSFDQFSIFGLLWLDYDRNHTKIQISITIWKQWSQYNKKH